MNYQAPHDVRDINKLESMIKALESGEELPPVLVCGEIAYSGSHRLAAWDAMEIKPEVIELDDGDIAAAMEYVGLDPMYDDIQRFDEIEDAMKELGIV